MTDPRHSAGSLQRMFTQILAQRMTEYLSCVNPTAGLGHRDASGVHVSNPLIERFASARKPFRRT